MSSLSEIDIRDWDRAEEIVKQVDVVDHDVYKNGALTNDQYEFLIKLIETAKRAYIQPKRSAILSWWKP